LYIIKEGGASVMCYFALFLFPLQWVLNWDISVSTTSPQKLKFLLFSNIWHRLFFDW